MKMYYSILFKVLSCLCLIVFYLNISCGQTVRLKKSEGFIQTNDYIRLHYQILGEGKDTILVIHGGTSFGSSYLIPDLTPLAAHHTLLFFDQAGAGYSSIIEDTARYNIQRIIQDIETIRKHFRLQKINLLGHSTGGLICGYYASLYPERIQSMILISPLPLSASWMANYNTDKKHDSTSLFILRQNRKKYRSSPIDSIKACWDYYALWARGQFPTYAHARNAWGNICNCNQANLLSPYSYYLFKSLGNWDIAGRLTKVKSRVLILGGEQDEIPYESFQQWNKSLSNSLLLKFKASAHMPHIDEPEAFFSAVEQFLINKWPNDTTIEYRGSGVILPMDNKGTTYIKSRVQVIEVENELVRLINNQKWDSVANVYISAGVIYPPGAPPVMGREAIATFWRTASLRGLHKLELQLIDIEQSGDLLISQGKYLMRNARMEILDIGKFIAIYRKEKNKWRLQTDMFNSNLETRSPVEIPDYLTLPENK